MEHETDQFTLQSEGDFNFLSFQNEMMEALEELRFRRRHDKEQENRLQQLQRERYQLGQRLEEIVMKQSAAMEEYEEKYKNHEFHLQEKLSKAQEENRRYAISVTKLKEELRSTKDDMQILQMENMTLANKVNALEGQLKMQSNIYQTATRQGIQFNQVYQNVLRQVQQVLDSQSLLKQQARGILEANKKLELQTRQAKHAEESLMAENESLKKEIIWVRSEVTQVRSDIDPLKHKMEIERLERQITKLKQDAKQANTLLDHSKEEGSKMLKALQEASMLSHQYREQITQQREENGQLKNYLYELKSMEKKWLEKNTALQSALEECQARNKELLKTQEKPTMQDAYCQHSFPVIHSTVSVQAVNPTTSSHSQTSEDNV